MRTLMLVSGCDRFGACFQFLDEAPQNGRPLPSLAAAVGATVRAVE